MGNDEGRKLRLRTIADELKMVASELATAESMGNVSRQWAAGSRAKALLHEAVDVGAFDERTAKTLKESQDVDAMVHLLRLRLQGRHEDVVPFPEEILEFVAYELQQTAEGEIPLRKEATAERLILDSTNGTIFFDGTRHVPTKDGFAMLAKLVKARGSYVSSTDICEFQGQRIDRIKNRLPQVIRDIIQSKRGTGYRLTIYDAGGE